MFNVVKRKYGDKEVCVDYKWGWGFFYYVTVPYYNIMVAEFDSRNVNEFGHIDDGHEGAFKLYEERFTNNSEE